MDLREYGHLDSRSPMPVFVYGLRCWPLDGGPDIADIAPLDVPHRSPRPLCRFLLMDLAKRFLALQRPDADPKETPWVYIAYCEDDDGMGSTCGAVCGPAETSRR